MDKNGTEKILATLKAYSETAEEVVVNLQKYDYRNEALEWDPSAAPAVMESSHPTLRDLHIRLARFIATITWREDNLQRDQLLSRNNLEAVIAYLNVCQDTLTGAKFNRVSIEPMLNVAQEFENLNLLTESRRLRFIYEFAYAIRQWNRKAKYNPGTPIHMNVEINYDDATPDELKQDEGYTIFASLFKPSCNYITKQKRTIYNELKKLYTTIDPKDADRTVMAVILLFRKKKSSYGRPFSDERITKCKEKAMTAFGRDTKVIRSYTENSLTGNPPIGLDHVNRAESIIKTALATTR